VVIESVHVTNFRSIKDEVLQCDDLTVLVGANGTGKSSFLRAIELFYSAAPRVVEEDFYNRDTSHEVTIALTFRDLPQAAQQQFKDYLQNDRLTVEAVVGWNDAKPSVRLHGSSLQSSDFQACRQAGNASEKKMAYNEIRSKSEYSTLRPWKNQGDAETALKEWESANPAKCARMRDDGQFFGFKEVGQGYLGRFTKFLFVPAVRDASNESADAKGTVLTALMDLVVRSVLAAKQSVVNLRDATQQQYAQILDPSKLTELQGLKSDLNSTLRGFVPNAAVDLKWLPLAEVDIPLPKADVKLIEDDFPTEVSHAGHGLQRAFIMTMLQQLVKAQAATAATGPNAEVTSSTAVSQIPNLILAIEEPELYQHPNRQRHFARILSQLASGSTPGVADRTQVIYGTHSPLLILIDRVANLRLLRKVPVGKTLPRATKVYQTDLDGVADVLWKADGQPAERYTGDALLPRLRAIMTPWLAEGFFADIVVLVEGEDDRAAIAGVAQASSHDLERDGIAVIPCAGKKNLSRPSAIFTELQIPVYMVWDGDGERGESAGVCPQCGRRLDRKPDPKDNHSLLRLVGRNPEDWPCYCEGKFACFKRDLNATLRDEIGCDLFDELLQRCQEKYGFSERTHALKNPALIAEVIQEARKKGKSSSTLESIVTKVLTLRTQLAAESAAPVS
jgi:hypothetical protein